MGDLSFCVACGSYHRPGENTLCPITLAGRPSPVPPEEGQALSPNVNAVEKLCRAYGWDPRVAPSLLDLAWAVEQRARREAIEECVRVVESLPDFAGRTGDESMEGILRAAVLAALRKRSA